MTEVTIYHNPACETSAVPTLTSDTTRITRFFRQ